MLSYFFDNTQQTSHLFKGLNIAHNGDVMGEINAYPTIFITFKDIKDNVWQDCLLNTKMMLSNLYKEKESFLKNVLADKDELKYYRSIVEMTATEVAYKNSLKNLIQYLEREYDKKVILIIDEYDIPIQSGWTHGYYEDVIDFMRVFLSAALKDNANLFKGILTGIYRVAKESVFSGLNNLSVFTVLNKDYAEYFGFTEEETVKIIKTLGMENIEGITQGMKEWYNGYRFGDETVYNPWSVLNYLRFQELKPYWIKSNRESGKGRYDILLKAKDKNNYSAVIEIKADASDKSVEEALGQIEKKEYVQELKSEGYTRILKVALGVDGKSVNAVGIRM
jgi:hypothetical protein